MTVADDERVSPSDTHTDLVTDAGGADPGASDASSSDADASAASDQADQRTEREQLLDVVKDAVAKTDGADTDTERAGDTAPADTTKVAGDTAADGSAAGQDKTAPQADADPDPTEAELKAYKPATRRRVEKLLTQRNEVRAELARIQPDLAAHRQFRGYLERANLDADDVNNLLGVGANLRAGNWEAFLKGVMPYVQTAQEALGQRLPKDLQDQVDEGALTQAAAAELIRARFTVARAEGQVRQTEAQQTAQQAEARRVSITNAVDNWEANVRSRDPDYAEKAVAVRKFSQALMQERGIPRNAEEAVALAQAALNDVQRDIRHACGQGTSAESHATNPGQRQWINPRRRAGAEIHDGSRHDGFAGRARDVIQDTGHGFYCG